MKKDYGVVDEIGRWFGLVMLAALVIGAIAGVLYVLLDNMTDTGRHWLAVILVMGLPLAFALGLQVGKAHVKGVERGLDLKVNATRAANPPKPVLAQPTTSRAAQYDDLLPKPAVIVQRRDDDVSPIEM